jgi:N-carbamoyl-L-amino-acid hydrolase
MARASDFIDQKRLWDRHMAIAKFGETGNGGVNRQALTDDDRRARAALAEWAHARGFEVLIDEAANMHIRREGWEQGAPVVLSGSHLDTQPAGGNFDGVYGVLAAFEVLEALEDGGIRTRRPVEAVVWTNEEGCRFAPGCTGSMVFAGVGTLADYADAAALDGARFGEEVARTIAATPHARHRDSGIPLAGYIEAHIEQGPRLEAERLSIGAVTGIQGGSSFEITVTGEEGHAGTVPLALRRDAMRSAVAVVNGLHDLMADPDDIVKFTIGRFQAFPGSPNTIPGKVVFTIDFRHPDADVFNDRVGKIEAVCREHAAPCDVSVFTRHVNQPSVFPDDVVAMVEGAARRLDLPVMAMPSGAGHDAQLIAPLCPTGMLFVPCLKGISHSESECAKAEDLAAGARVLADVLLEMAESWSCSSAWPNRR